MLHMRWFMVYATLRSIKQYCVIACHTVLYDIVIYCMSVYCSMLSHVQTCYMLRHYAIRYCNLLQCLPNLFRYIAWCVVLCYVRVRCGITFDYVPWHGSALLRILLHYTILCRPFCIISCYIS